MEKIGNQITIEILSKDDCSLCDVAKETVQDAAKEFNCEVVIVDIETDENLFKEYCEKIPVVKINGEQAFVYKVHPITLRNKLAKVYSK